MDEGMFSFAGAAVEQLLKHSGQLSAVFDCAVLTTGHACAQGGFLLEF